MVSETNVNPSMGNCWLNDPCELSNTEWSTATGTFNLPELIQMHLTLANLSVWSTFGAFQSFSSILNDVSVDDTLQTVDTSAPVVPVSNQVRGDGASKPKGLARRFNSFFVDDILGDDAVPSEDNKLLGDATDESLQHNRLDAEGTGQGGGSMPSNEAGNSSQHSSASTPTAKLPAWVFCTRYSDRPSSGPRVRKPRRMNFQEDSGGKRPRTSFSTSQLKRLSQEFEVNRYLDENRRQGLAGDLGLRESQVKIWFQNKRAKTKKVNGSEDRLAYQLMQEGLYNHSVRTLHEEQSRQRRKCC